MKSIAIKSLLLALAVASTGVVTTGAVYADAAGDALTREAQAAITPEKALDYSSRSSQNAEFVQAVAEMNVELTMKKLRDRSVVLREMIDKGEIGLVGAMYDVSSGKVVFD